MRQSSTTKVTSDATGAAFDKFAAPAALAYFALYFIYQILYIDLVSELNHWLTLVLVPATIVFLGLRFTTGRTGARAFFRTFNLHFDHFGKALLVALIAGVVLGFVQLLLSRSAGAILESIKSGEYFYKLPIALLAMLATAGFTEEFFFRGFIQTSLERRTRSRLWSVGVSSLLFGIYHFPYAYYKESWPTHGDFLGAVSEGVVFSTVIGVILGGLYSRWKNLFIPILVHALFNAIWFATKINL